MTKFDLRKIYLEKQKSFSDTERSEKSRRICNRFFENFDLTKIKFLHVFLTIEKKREIETAFILQHLWKNFPEVSTIAARVNFKKMTLENTKFNSETKLALNKWQILEPTGKEPFEIEKIDAVLVPLSCFDKLGFRVGYGKGFYDKFLGECRKDCLKIGLSYFAPIEKISDAQVFDAKLDFCVTPDAVFGWQDH